MSQLDKVLKFIDDNQPRFIDNLRKAVAIKNVSAWKSQPSTFNQLSKMINFVEKKLLDLGFKVEKRKVGQPQQMDNGKEEELPKVIFASLETDLLNDTLLIYGHLDVQPAKLSDGWDYDPFTLTEVGPNLYGRGTFDDKGPVLGWLHCIEALIKCKAKIPVNIKMVLESLEEVGSDGLEDLLKREKYGFLSNVDAIAISDNYWLGTDYPCLTYGLRGLLYFQIVVDGGSKDLHSGVFGGAVHEPMWDLVWMLNQLVDPKGNIIIPGINKNVEVFRATEKQTYSELKFSMNKFKTETGVHKTRFPDKERTLAHRWRFPSLSIHGIEGAFSDPGAKTVIPRRVVGKFSIRIVPNQQPNEVAQLVKDYLRQKWEQRDSPNKFKLEKLSSGKWWKEDVGHANYKAAANAIKHVYHKDPQYTREGGSIPITLVFQELTKKNVLLLPMGQGDDGAHSQNEKISRNNFINGTKVFAAYIMGFGDVDDNDDDDDEAMSIDDEE